MVDRILTVDLVINHQLGTFMPFYSFITPALITFKLTSTNIGLIFINYMLKVKILL